MFKVLLSGFKSWKVISITLLLISLIIAEIYFTNQIPHWREVFFGSLNKKSYDLILSGVYLGIYILGGISLIQGFKSFVSQHLALDLRTHITSHLQNLYKPNSGIEGVAQRINLDVYSATSNTLDLIVESSISLMIVISLIIGNWHNTLIMIAAGIYTLIMTLMMYVFNGKLCKLDISLQKEEAWHRTSIANAEVGLETCPKTAYNRVVEATKNWLWGSLGFQLFNRTQGNFMPLLGYALLIPSLVAGPITFGQFMGQSGLFDLIVINSTIILSMYLQFIKSQASWVRLNEYYKQITE